MWLCIYLSCSDTIPYFPKKSDIIGNVILSVSEESQWDPSQKPRDDKNTMSSFFSFSFGCRVNEAEKVTLDKKLLEMGFLWSEKNPDFYIINSCAVTGKAEREVRQHIYQIRKKFPKTKIVVTGCAATNWVKNSLMVQGVDLLIQNSDKQSIPRRLMCHPEPRIKVRGKLREGSSPDVRQDAPQDSSPDLIGIRMTSKPYSPDITNYYDKFLHSGRLMVKIQDGCDRFCSYCIVPYLRGKPKSKRIAKIIAEIQSYAQSCHSRSNPLRLSETSRESREKNLDSRLRGNDRKKLNNDINILNEVILTAINTGCFGKDTGETLIELIDAILKQTSVPKISFGSIHPWSITDEFLEYYRSILPTNRFIPFFHIPIQSGSNTILKLMNRGYTIEEIYRKLKEIKKINPDTFIGTDIIVGFPGETEKEFQETYEFLQKAPIDKIHVFRYSPRPGTTAEKFKKIYDESTPEEKRRRAKMIIEIKSKANNI